MTAPPAFRSASSFISELHSEVLSLGRMFLFSMPVLPDLAQAVWLAGHVVGCVDGE